MSSKGARCCRCCTARRRPSGGGVFSEYDYSMLEARLILNQPIRDSRLFMVFDGRWKYIHATGFRPMLFDLESDRANCATSAPIRPTPGERRGCATELLDWALPTTTG